MASINHVLAVGKVTGLDSRLKYSLKKFIAGGDNGEVYLAERDDGKQFAVKVCQPDQLGTGKRNLKPEIDRLAILSKNGGHRNVIQMEEEANFFPGHVRNQLCYSMEKCDITLQDLMDGPQISELAFTEICYQAFSGLAFVHSKNIVHRDLRNPGNILLQWDGQRARVVLVDFGNGKEMTQQHPQSYVIDFDARRLAFALLKLIRRRCLSDPSTVNPPKLLPSASDWDFLYDTMNIPDSDKKDFSRAISLTCCVCRIPGFNEVALREIITHDREWWTKLTLHHPKRAAYIHLIFEFLSQTPGPDGTKISSDLCNILGDALGFTDLQGKEAATLENRLETLCRTSKMSTHDALMEHLTNVLPSKKS